MGHGCCKLIISFTENSSDSLPSLLAYKRNNSSPRNSSLYTSKDPKINEFQFSPTQNELTYELKQYQKAPIIENYILVWLTSNLAEDENSIKQIQRMVTSFRLFTNIDEFFAFIIHIKDEKLFLILSNEFAQKIISLIHQMSQLYSIYIISHEKSIDEQWIKTYKKIQGIFYHIEPICKQLKYQIHLSKYDIIPIKLLDSSLFIIQYLMKEILLDEKMKTDFLDFARKEYPNEFDIIKEFEDNYSPSTAIWWYTRKCFLYLAMHKAFQTQNIELLMKMNFFIQDLHQQIDRLYKKIEHRNAMVVYRGQGISKNELEILKNNQNGLFSFNNFLWTDTNRDISLSSARLARNNPNFYGVLFRIEINSGIKFISLEQLSYYLNSKNEILFSIYSLFRIIKIQKIEEKIWEIHLTLIDNKDQQFNDNLRSIENLEGQTAWEKLGFYFLETNQLNQAEELYKTLIKLNSLNNPEQLALLNEQLGFISHKKHDSINALQYYEKSLKNYLLFLSANDSSLLPIYLNIGILLYQQKKNINEAINYLKCALNIALHSYKYDHSQITLLYYRIADIYEGEGLFIDAIQNYQLALESELNCYPLDHLSVAKTYTKIGEILLRSEDYTTAFAYFDKTLEIQKKSLSPNHSILAGTNYHIAITLVGLHQYKEAIEYASRAVNIARHSFGSNHENVRLYERYLKNLRRKTLVGVIPNGAVYE